MTECEDTEKSCDKPCDVRLHVHRLQEEDIGEMDPDFYSVCSPTNTRIQLLNQGTKMNAIVHNDPMLCDNLRKGIKYLENSKLEFEDMKKEFCMDYWVGIKKE